FVSFNHHLLNGPVLVALNRLLCSLFFVFIILEQNYCENSIVKMSSRRWISTLGKYTYGLYLLHPIAIQFTLRLPRLLNVTLADLGDKLLVAFGGLLLSLVLA